MQKQFHKMLFEMLTKKNQTLNFWTAATFNRLLATNLAVFADKFQQRVDNPLEEVDDELLEVVSQDIW